MPTEQYDVVVLGSGEAGKYVAWTQARKGMRAVVVERKYIGGSCPNIACMPSKNVIHTSKVASYFRHREEFGIARNDFKIDMSVVRDRKRRMVAGLNEMYMAYFRSTGAELIFAEGRFVGPKTVEATFPDGTRRQLRGTNVIVSTGTHAAVEAVPGLVESRPLTHIEALELDQVPEHLIVIGG